MFSITGLGACQEVGRSAFVLDFGEKFLLDYGVKLYPRAWYLKQCHENGGYAPIGIQFYKLPDETIAYKYKDDEELPFEELFF